MSATATKRPTIRQNPPAAQKPPSGEHCPAHGWFLPPPAVGELRRQATGHPDVPAELARELLAESQRLRRWCPECGDVCPTGPQWAASVRLGAERSKA